MSEYFGSYSPNTPQTLFINPGLTNASKCQCDKFTVPHTVICRGVIYLLCESKIYEFHVCLMLPNILGKVTCIKSRRVTTPLKFVSDPELTCLF